MKPDDYVIEKATHQLTELMGCSQVNAFTHTHTLITQHTNSQNSQRCTRTHIHRDAHLYTHILYTSIHAHKQLNTYTLTYRHSHLHLRTHTLSLTLLCSQKTLIVTLIHSYYMHSQSHTQGHILYSHACTHKHTSTHTNTHTNTHTHSIHSTTSQFFIYSCG